MSKPRIIASSSEKREIRKNTPLLFIPKEKAIKKLAQIFSSTPEFFLQLMAVYEGKKPGFFGQIGDSDLKKITPYIRVLELSISFKHGGYVSKKPHLAKSWNGMHDSLSNSN